MGDIYISYIFTDKSREMKIARDICFECAKNNGEKDVGSSSKDESVHTRAIEWSSANHKSCEPKRDEESEEEESASSLVGEREGISE